LLCWCPTIKMEVVHSYEKSVHKRSTRRYIPENGKNHNYRCENLKSYFFSLVCLRRCQ
jgi:hypothetical protein